MDLSATERAVLTALQRGIALVERPFQGFLLPEDEVVALLRRAQAEGLVRRFGGVFDSRRLGFMSLLCALDAPPERLAALAEVIVANPGVTHCYERRPLIGQGRCPPLWFTLALPDVSFDAGLEALRGQLDGAELMSLPALRRFKIDVVFDLGARLPGAPIPTTAALPGPPPMAVRLTETERALVRLLDQQLPVSARPFDGVARHMGRPVADVLDMLCRWREQGVLRRIAAVLYHRQAGFTCNGMCVWPVADGIEDAGLRVAARPEVTHCYQRSRRAAFPYDLYAMLHTTGRNAAVALYHRVTAECGLPAGMMCVSTRERKKSSMRYFPD